MTTDCAFADAGQEAASGWDRVNASRGYPKLNMPGSAFFAIHSLIRAAGLPAAGEKMKESMRTTDLNLPNKLTILRFIMVPVFMVFLTIEPLYTAIGDTAARMTALILFILAALTDLLDGKIARKYNLVTDFGKFMDPLADKLMVFGALLGLLYYSFVSGADALFCKIFVWAAFIVMLRELAVTSMRLVVSGKSGQVIAAQWSGKVKTVTQMVCIMVCIAEPVWAGVYGGVPYLSYGLTAAMIFMTVYSGVEYFIKYMPLMDSNK